MKLSVTCEFAATYCLTLRPPLVRVPELRNLIRDVLHDVKEENDSFSSTGPIISEHEQINTCSECSDFHAGRSGRSLLVNRMRVESIKFLTATLRSGLTAGLLFVPRCDLCMCRGCGQEPGLVPGDKEQCYSCVLPLSIAQITGHRRGTIVPCSMLS